MADLKLNSLSIVEGKLMFGASVVRQTYLGDLPIFQTIDPNEVYRNEFNTVGDLVDIIQDDFGNGSIDILPVKGTCDLGDNALTLKWTAPGSTPILARKDLGQVYPKLFIQFSVSIINRAAENGYSDMSYFTSGSAINLEAFQIDTNHNNADNYHNYYRTEGGTSLISDAFSTEGKWDIIGVEVDNIARTATYTINGVQRATQSIQARDVQWIQFGGFHLPGYEMQIKNLTVNTANFSTPPNSSYGIGQYSVQYVDPTMATNTAYDDGVNGPVDLTLIDKSNWSGQHSKPYSRTGDGNYTDGPLPYSGDININYFRIINSNNLRSKVLYKKGTIQYQKDLETTNKVNFNGNPTNITEYFEVSSYGESEVKPIIRNGIEYQGSWTLDDAPNNIYRSDVISTGFSRLNGVKLPEIDTFGLRQVTDPLELQNLVGVYYKDTDTVLIRLWDESDPNNETIAFNSNIGLTYNDYTRVKNIHFQMGGLVTGEGTVFTYNEFSIGAGLAMGESSVAIYNHFYRNWIGGNYTEQNEASTGAAAVSMGNNSLFAYNTLEESYIGIQIDYGIINSMIAFNIIKNVIVNYIQFSAGSTGHADFSEANKVINNTIFVSQKHTSNDPYLLPASSLGHGFIFQNSPAALTNNVEVINNLFLLHFNKNDLGGPGGANSFAQSSPIGAAIIDNNAYFKTALSDSTATHFTSSDGDDINLHRTRLSSYANGVEGGLVEGNSFITTTLPVVTANHGIDTEWEETDATPVVGSPIINTGYEYDFTEWSEYINVTGPRNIGAK